MINAITFASAKNGFVVPTCLTLIKPMKLCFAIILVLAPALSYCQDISIGSEINYEQIPYATVRNYVENQITILQSFANIRPSFKEKHSVSDYNKQQKSYLVKENLLEVWNKYVNTSPAESWNGKKVMFGFMFSKNENKPVYHGEPISCVDTGQVIFLNLKLLKFYNLAMAFEIISIDPENRIIEFSYIEGNKSEGKQCLKFVDTRKGYTKIIHSSYFKSDSKLRDSLLYPFFHTRTTNEFHRIMKRMICKKR